MVKLNPTKLHELLAGRAGWSPDLWRQAERTVQASLTGDEITTIVDLASLHSGSPRLKEFHGVLSDFRHLPPTVLLGAFGHVRYLVLRHAEIDSLVQDIHVEQQDLDYYSLRG